MTWLRGYICDEHKHYCFCCKKQLEYENFNNIIIVCNQCYNKYYNKNLCCYCNNNCDNEDYLYLCDNCLKLYKNNNNQCFYCKNLIT